MDTITWSKALDEYVAAGWEGTLPLPARSKQPPPRGTTSASGRWPSTADRFAWTESTPSDANLALWLPADVIGLDVDQYGDKAGADNLAAYTAEHDLPELPDTWRSTARPAPSGIRFYRVPEGVRLRGVVVPDVEVVQHRHRYAVVWPSIHPNGHPYRWLTPDGAFADRPPEIDELAELPAEWLEALQRAVTEYGEADYPPSAEHREAAWSARVVHEYDQAVAGLVKGSRHDTARDAQLALLRLEQLDHPGATAALDALGARFIATIGDERDGAAEWQEMLDEGRRIVQGSASTVRQDAELLADLRRVGEPPRAAETATEPASEAVEVFVDWAALWADDQDEEQWLFEPVFARGRGHVIYAGHKAGKSLFTLWTVAELIASRQNLDALYLDYEMTRADLRERLEDMGHGTETDLSRLHYALLPMLAPLDTAAGAAELLGLVDLVERPGNDLFVVIDTMSRAVEGEENSNDTVRDFYRHTGIALKRRGVTWVRLDHSGKDGERGQRGGSAKGDDVDVIWKLGRADRGTLSLESTARMAWVPDRVAYNIGEAPLRYERASHAWPAGTAAVADMLDQLDVPLDAGRNKAREALREAGQVASNETLSAALKYRRTARRTGLRAILED